MQTPRGFLIGAGVIAAIAAFASVGHPRSETDVRIASPTTSFVEQTPTINASSSDVDVLAERVEAGNVMPSTTRELAAPVPKAPAAPPTTVASEDETAPAVADEEGHRPAALGSEAPTTSPTTPPTTVSAAPPASSSPTSSSTTTVAPSLPLQPAIPGITIPKVTTPAITMPPITAPQPVGPIVTPPQIQIPAAGAQLPIVTAPVIETGDITRRAASAIAYDLPAA